jgi:hypothetical protein
MRSLLKRSLSYLRLRHAEAVKGRVLLFPPAARAAQSLDLCHPRRSIYAWTRLQGARRKWAGGS